MSKASGSIPFDEGSTIRFMDAPLRLDGTVLLQADIVSWDLRVYDRDAVRPNSPKTVIYSLLGQDPDGLNTNGDVYVSTALRTDGGWDKNRSGHSFRLDLNTQLFDHEGGHVYAFEFTFSTLLDGQVFRTWLCPCNGSQTE